MAEWVRQRPRITTPTNWVEAIIAERESLASLMRRQLKKEGRLQKVWASDWNRLMAPDDEKNLRRLEEDLARYHSILDSGHIPEPSTNTEGYFHLQIERAREHGAPLDYSARYQASDASLGAISDTPSELRIGVFKGDSVTRMPKPSMAATDKQIDYIRALAKGESDQSSTTVMLGDPTYLTRREASDIITRLKSLGYRPRSRFTDADFEKAPWRIHEPAPSASSESEAIEDIFRSIRKSGSRQNPKSGKMKSSTPKSKPPRSNSMRLR